MDGDRRDGLRPISALLRPALVGDGAGVGSVAFAEGCDALLRVAEAEAAQLAPPSMLPQLRAIGYDPREIDEIRACIDIFHPGNMPYLLMATLARLLLEGGDWPGGAGSRTPAPRRAVPARPILVEAHHADPTIAAVYADIRETLGLPFVNTDYRAFARWPSYFAPAWGALRGAVTGPGYADRLAAVHHAACAIARHLPNPGGLTAEALQRAAAADAPKGEVLAVVRLFQWLLPGLAVNVAYLRAGLVA